MILYRAPNIWYQGLYKKPTLQVLECSAIDPDRGKLQLRQEALVYIWGMSTKTLLLLYAKILLFQATSTSTKALPSLGKYVTSRVPVQPTIDGYMKGGQDDLPRYLTTTYQYVYIKTGCLKFICPKFWEGPWASAANTVSDLLLSYDDCKAIMQPK